MKKRATIYVPLCIFFVLIVCAGLYSGRENNLEINGGLLQDTEETSIALEELMPAAEEETADAEEEETEGGQDTETVYDMYDLTDTQIKALSLTVCKSGGTPKPCTREELMEMDMPSVYKDVLCGDWSAMENLSELDKSSLEDVYRMRKQWQFILKDMNDDGKMEMWVKDEIGRTGMVYADMGGFGAGVYMWEIGDPGFGDLFEDAKYRTVLLQNGNSFEILKSVGGENDENIRISIYEYKLRSETFTSITEAGFFINIVNDIDGYEEAEDGGVHQEHPANGIYYYKDAEDSKSFWKQISGEELDRWLEETLSQVIPEDEWTLVP